MRQLKSRQHKNKKRCCEVWDHHCGSRASTKLHRQQAANLRYNCSQPVHPSSSTSAPGAPPPPNLPPSHTAQCASSCIAASVCWRLQGLVAAWHTPGFYISNKPVYEPVLTCSQYEYQNIELFPLRKSPQLQFAAGNHAGSNGITHGENSERCIRMGMVVGIRPAQHLVEA
eukprot:364885-Chlamydomonas_euryale.AAC.6